MRVLLGQAAPGRWWIQCHRRSIAAPIGVHRLYQTPVTDGPRLDVGWVLVTPLGSVWLRKALAP